MKGFVHTFLSFGILPTLLNCSGLAAPRLAATNIVPIPKPPTVAIATPPIATNDFAIPRLEGVHVDGNLTDWGTAGFSIEVLAADQADRRDVEQFDARARLAWDHEGLLIALDVTDTTKVEAGSIEELYRHDSVEFFLTKRPGAPDAVQFIASPGLDSKFSEPRVRFYDKRDDPALRKDSRPLIVGRTMVVNGYRLEAKLPWSLLRIESTPGTEFGFQFYVADSGRNGEVKRLIWYPEADTHTRTGIACTAYGWQSRPRPPSPAPPA